jgi:hypothetical protein
MASELIGLVELNPQVKRSPARSSSTLPVISPIQRLAIVL